MAEFYLTNKAVQDLNNIWNYTFEEWSEEQADKYYQLLIGTCIQIAKNPSLGRTYFAIVPNLYGFKVNRHIIFYRIENKEKVEITRILHERMDLENRVAE